MNVSRTGADRYKKMARNPALDVLRGIAIILVFSRHSEGAIILSHLGWAGVDLFFVLSGFLVSGLLFSEYKASTAIDPGRFLLRRGWKIYPQFYTMIAVTLLFEWLAKSPPSAAAAASKLLFVQNYHPGLWAHTWSLAVEEHFYLGLALSIWLMSRRGGEARFTSSGGGSPCEVSGRSPQGLLGLG